MKKLVLLALFGIVFAIPSSAQYSQYLHRDVRDLQRSNRSNRNNDNYTSRWNHYNRETYVGLRLGVAVSSVNSDDSRLDGGDALSGLNLGIVAGTQLAPSTPLFLEAGLFYTEKGGKGTYQSKTFKYNLDYLEVPIVVKYKYFIDDDFSIQPYFGGFLACGVGGKVKDYGDRQSSDSFSDDYFQRFDGGLRLGCGMSFQNLYVDVAYDFGLANICHSDFDTSHTGCFYANIGVDF